MIQRLCPPCRQSMEGYDNSLYVEHEDKRVYVCCTGCAAKMEQYWDGYIKIINEQLHDTIETISTPVESFIIVNKHNKGVCGPCKTGLCMLKEHLPPEAKSTWTASIGNVYGKIFHNPKL